jgi:hypothetical protein
MSKGILITHYDDTTIKSPAIIEEKMEELFSFAACDQRQRCRALELFLI